jgi:hypothetical protein
MSAASAVASAAVVAAAVPHRGPDRIEAHLLLAVGVFAVAALAWYGMWRGWRRRARTGHPDLPPPPQPPAPDERGRVLVPPVTGLYVGTVTAADWRDRVVAHGLSMRATGRLRVTEQGALIERDDAGPVWIPAAALWSGRIDEALAGHVMGRAGLLVIGWRHGPYELESGFRADDRDTYAGLLAALKAILPTDTPATGRTDGPAPPYPEPAEPAAAEPAAAEPAAGSRAVGTTAAGSPAAATRAAKGRRR